MKKLFSILLLLPIITQAHPGIGIVKDSKGNIFYTTKTSLENHKW